ncbi:MAG: 50S ribosomal protein L35 [Candidatus Vogelbacteria bacterium]|nr:50S ribosomal protein L35 [Candidatus Vogelbacteria bacterium]
MKTNKTYSKRIKRTRTGKLIARRAGQNHFNAKASRSKQLGRKRTQTLHMIPPKELSRYLPN